MAIVQPISVEGENFGTWKKISYQFSDLGKYLIIGKNESGKSTFFEFPFWILFGENTKNLKVDEVVNWYVKKNCWGRFTFKKGKDEFAVERYRKHETHGNEVLFFKNGKEITKTKNTQEEIEKAWGLNYTATICSILLSQAKMATFLEIKGADRHKLFDSIMRMSLINPFEQKVKNRFTFLKKEFHRNKFN